MALRHPALAASAGRPLSTRVLTDRQRLSLLLQACALLAHLRLVRWRPLAGWERARVDQTGTLRGVPAGPGGALDWPQERLIELASLLFDSPLGEISGRGQARRIARDRVRTWSQALVPLSPDAAVGQLLDAAGFLWSEPFGPARAALAAEHRLASGARLWVAGPGWFRRRLLAGVSGWRGLRRRLESAEAVASWRGPVARAGGSSVGRARRLLANGRFRSAQAALRSIPGPAAEALAVSSRARLGSLEAARRQLGRLEPQRLTEDELVELAETAVWLHCNLGRPRAARDWVERALEVRGGSARRRALLTAASFAWDRGDLRQMDRYLELARPAPGERAPSWRWRQVAGLGALARRDASSACRHLAAAMRDSRRRLGRFEAAALWNDLGVARAAAGDLEGAERALVHAVRLHDRAEGPQRTTLALFNLAELRLRRGRLRGVREILDRSTRCNLESRNWRGLAYDRELLARFELVRGRPERALERVAAALEELDRLGIGARRSALHALAARALGWLGRRRSAARSLARVEGGVAGLFESEELPALWALAGERERAAQSIAAGPAAPLWEEALGRRRPRPGAWRGLGALEPFRRARLIADLALVSPASVPQQRIRWAARVLDRIGNEWLARRLEGLLEGGWTALETYLAGPRGDAGGLAELFRQAGHPDASLRWRRPGAEHEIVAGAAGPEELHLEVGGGRLILRTSRIDGAARALFALAARDWRPPPAAAGPDADGVIGECPALRAALERARRLAARDVPILILGETGTGKELVARLVHRSSPRRSGPQVTLNSAALSETLVLSELFGHVRGAFTGADRDRPGIFETARGGTVFLDELGDLPLRAQGMLLRVLQEGEVRRLGESRVRRVDVRVIAATHRALEQLVAEGRFRQDLFYRLAVGRVELPPLRERGGDLDLLIRHFAQRLSPERPLVLSAAAVARLRAHSWPGNVRELANCLAVAAALAEGNQVRARHLGLPAARSQARGSYHQRVLEFRRRLVSEALRAAGGNRAAAARHLGVSRQALSYLVRALGIE